MLCLVSKPSSGVELDKKNKIGWVGWRKKNRKKKKKVLGLHMVVVEAVPGNTSRQSAFRV